MAQKTFTLFTDQSLAGNVTSNSISTQYVNNIGIHLHWIGTPEGIFYVDASNNSTDWFDLNIEPVPTAGGIEANWGISIVDLPYAYLRVRYIRSSGTGSASAFVMLRGGIG
jgi:hypothetical protein